MGRDYAMNQSIHDLVTATLREMGIVPAPGTLQQTFALGEGRLVAEKFRYDGGYAVWVVGRGSVDFYDEDGSLLRSVGVEAADEQERGTAA
jgi:hypothetical protein